jgi:hypothetical protein
MTRTGGRVVKLAGVTIPKNPFGETLILLKSSCSSRHTTATNFTHFTHFYTALIVSTPWCLYHCFNSLFCSLFCSLLLSSAGETTAIERCIAVFILHFWSKLHQGGQCPLLCSLLLSARYRVGGSVKPRFFFNASISRSS